MDAASEDRAAGDRERAARDWLTARGGHELPRFPWLASGQPHDAGTLIRHTLWRANTRHGELDVPADLRAALTLLAAARSELDQLEAGLLFAARAEGLTWVQIAEALGLRTAQAAQQRHDRVVARLVEDAGS